MQNVEDEKAGREPFRVRGDHRRPSLAHPLLHHAEIGAAVLVEADDLTVQNSRVPGEQSRQLPQLGERGGVFPAVRDRTDKRPRRPVDGSFPTTEAKARPTTEAKARMPSHLPSNRQSAGSVTISTLPGEAASD